MPAQPIPDGAHSLTPHLVCAGAAAAIDFYVAVFGAVDPFGHHWSVATHQRDLSADQIRAAAAEMMAKAMRGCG